MDYGVPLGCCPCTVHPSHRILAARPSIRQSLCTQRTQVRPPVQQKRNRNSGHAPNPQPRLAAVTSSLIATSIRRRQRSQSFVLAIGNQTDWTGVSVFPRFDRCKDDVLASRAARHNEILFERKTTFDPFVHTGLLWGYSYANLGLCFGKIFFRRKS